MVTFVLVAMLFFRQFVFGGYAPYWEDLLHYFYPIAHLATGSQARPLVFWNPYTFSGVPLAANPQTFTFYPFRTLFYVLPLDRAMVYLLVSHVAAAGLSMYVFLRVCRLAWAPALLGGLVFMLSSYVVSHFFHVTMTLAVAWTPLVLLGTHLVVQDQRLPPAMWGGVASGMQILAGHVQTWYLTLLMCLCYAVGLAASGSGRADRFRWLRIGGLLIVLACVALAVSSIQLVPLLDIVKRLERPQDTYGFATLYSLGPGFVRLLVPFYFGAPQSNNYWGGWDYWELAGYVGILPLLLAIVGLTASKRTERYTLAGCIVLGLALALGEASPVYSLAYRVVPLLSTFRAPARFLLWVTIGIAMLSSFGLEALLKREKSSKLLFFALTAGTAILVVLYGLWRLTDQFHAVFLSLGLADKFVHLGERAPAEILTGLIGSARRSTEVAAFWTISSLAILVLYFLRRLPSALALTATFTLTIADLAYAGITFNPGVRPEMLKPPCTVTQSIQNPDSRVYMTETYQKWLDHKYHDYSGFGPASDYVRGLATSLYPNINVLYDVQSIEGYDPLRNDAYRPILGAIRSQLSTYGTSPLLDFLGGRYILSNQPLGHFQFRPSASNGATKVYENPGAFHKFTVVPTYRVIANDEEAYHLLFSGALNLRQTVLVNRDPFPGRVPPRGPVAAGVLLQEYSPDSVRVSVTVNRPAVLVMNDVFYPGWRATVDGRPEEILQANVAFRALPLLEGHHTVVFWYRPPWLTLSAGLSLGALLLTIGLAVVGHRSKRTRRGSAAFREAE